MLAGPAHHRRSRCRQGGDQVLRRARAALRGAARGAHRARRPRRRARRRRGRRSRRFRRRDPAARRALRADADDAAGPGRFLGRRQDRHQPRHGKNLVGAFHQPSLVLADTALLDSLPERELSAGYAEVVKYGLIGDAAFFDWCEANWRAVVAGGPERDARDRRACRAKAAIVAATSARTATAPCSISATPSAMRSSATGFLRPAGPWRGGRHRHGLAFRFSAARSLPGQDAEPASRRHLAAVGLPTASRRVPGGCATPTRWSTSWRRTRRSRRAADLHPGPRHRRGFIARDVERRQVRAFLAGDAAVIAAQAIDRQIRRLSRSRGGPSLAILVLCSCLGLLQRPPRPR